ncbi:MAG: rRNA adenine N-6-methyltransferase family protein [Candidatus Aenigmatarchaeota archaeon]
MQEFLLILGLILSYMLYYMLKSRLAIFFPSFKGMIKIIEKLAEVKSNDVVYDLGSGDGRVLEIFAKKGIRCVGIEKNRFLVNISRKKIGKYKNAKIIEGDILEQDLSEASIIIAYLSRFLTRDIEKKIKKECKKGTKIILVSYRFDSLKPVKVEKWFWMPISLYIL